MFFKPLSKTQPKIDSTNQQDHKTPKNLLPFEHLCFFIYPVRKYNLFYPLQKSNPSQNSDCHSPIGNPNIMQRYGNQPQQKRNIPRRNSNRSVLCVLDNSTKKFGQNRSQAKNHKQATPKPSKVY